jgi:hypothetical protein
MNVNQAREITYSRDGNSVSNLLQHGARRCQGRRCDILADVVVDDNRSHGVEDNLECLQHYQSLWEVPGLLHLSKQTEEGDVSAVGKDNVGDGAESAE